MPPRCKAPKCAEVANKCACPNPWTEFLAKNAHKGKTTMAQHSAAYKALKDSGAFEPKAGLNNGGCKSDPVKLCAWKIRRKAGHRDLVAPVAGKGAARNDRILRREVAVKKPDILNTEAMAIIDDLYRTSGILEKDWYDENMTDHKAILEHWSSIMNLKDKGLVLTKVIGQGDSGSVFGGTLKTSSGTRKVAVKFTSTHEVNDKTIAREVYNHQMMYKALPHRVPKLYKVFKLRGRVSDEDGYLAKPMPHYPHLMVMEQISFDAKRLIVKYKKDVKLMTHVLNDVKKLLGELTHAKMVHGDFYFDNIGYKMAGGKPKMYMIDFASSWRTTESYAPHDAGRLIISLSDRFKQIRIAIDFPVLDERSYSSDFGKKAFEASVKLPKIPF